MLIENSVPRDHCFASLGKAWWYQTVTLRWNFLSSCKILIFSHLVESGERARENPQRLKYRIILSSREYLRNSRRLLLLKWLWFTFASFEFANLISFSVLKTAELVHYKAIWATSWESLFMPYANSKGADQLAHECSLISAFVVHCLDSIIHLLATAEISRR